MARPETASTSALSTGIRPLDERTGGLEPGGVYLVVGAPGPGKMVATLQFIHEGLSRGERVLLVTDSDAEGMLGVAAAWGFPLDAGWRDGTLQIVGFREDFALRAMRSIRPEEVLEELDELIEGRPTRIAIDPAALFLTTGARTILAGAFITWAKARPATVLATFSVDGDPTHLPSSADWLVKATTARLVLDHRADGIYDMAFLRPIPGPSDHEETVSVQLRPGEGLVGLTRAPKRRGSDRAGIDENRLLLLSLGDSHEIDLAAWADRTFDTDLVTEPLEAVTSVQEDAGHGCVLIHANRALVRQAIKACRALRPLTRAAIVFASDDTIRSTDRITLLEAGADDCLSGGLDFREVGLRIRQAMAAGPRKPTDARDAGAPPAEITAPTGGRVPRETFASEVAVRSEDPRHPSFCVLQIDADGLSDDQLEEELVALVRCDEGDLVSAEDSTCLVLVHGARIGQIGPLLGRIRDRLAKRSSSGDLVIRALAHPSEAAEIRALLGKSGDED